MRLVRWKAVAPLGLTLVVGGVGWILFGDSAVKREIEYAGAEIVGARVDVASARLSLRGGSVTLRGLEVTNPDQPMENLFEASEIVARVRHLPLLEKKVVIDTMLVRGVRFGTPRRISGALARKSPQTGRVARAISDWAGRIRIPPLNLRGVTTVVDLSRINSDSLRTAAAARSIVHQGDTLQDAWRRELSALDPKPQVDSARALVERLKQADLQALGLAGARDLLGSARGVSTQLGQAAARVQGLEDRVKAGVGSLRSQVDGLAQARAQDYAYARGLVNLPSLDAPDLSPALFGEMAVARLQPILYWLNLAEQYMPPGLDPRRWIGLRRLRAPGTTVHFPRAVEYPPFLLLFAGADAEISGSSAAAGRYAARLTGLTSAPALYGQPARFAAERAGGVRGPRAGTVLAVLNHVRTPINDSVTATLDGVGLPTVALPVAGARLELGSGRFQVRLTRTGESLDGTLLWRTTDARWARADSTQPSNRRTAEPAVGSAAWAQDLLWRTVSRLTTVEVEVRVAGRVTGPTLGIRSNVGREVAKALQRGMGDEVRRQEQRLRAQVDQLVDQPVKEAQDKVSTVETQVEAAVTRQRAELEQVKAELEGVIRELTRKLPIRIP